MRQLSTIFEQFEIAVVPFPFVDASRTKPRPALVLSARTFNQRNGHTLLAMITTAERTRWPSDYSIRDLPPTGLRVACVVRWKLFTLDNRALQRRVGRLGERDIHGCRAALELIFEDRQAQ
jgi:mRNA-degrading endonuclease toxin of MazEF toxin-antitoxin module